MNILDNSEDFIAAYKKEKETAHQLTQEFFVAAEKILLSDISKFTPKKVLCYAGKNSGINVELYDVIPHLSNSTDRYHDTSDLVRQFYEQSEGIKQLKVVLKKMDIDLCLVVRQSNLAINFSHKKAEIS